MNGNKNEMKWDIKWEWKQTARNNSYARK